MFELVLEILGYLACAALVGLVLGYLVWGWGRRARLAEARAEGALSARTSVDGDSGLRAQLEACGKERARLQDTADRQRDQIARLEARLAESAPVARPRAAPVASDAEPETEDPPMDSADLSQRAAFSAAAVATASASEPDAESDPLPESAPVLRNEKPTIPAALVEAAGRDAFSARLLRTMREETGAELEEERDATDHADQRETNSDDAGAEIGGAETEGAGTEGAETAGAETEGAETEVVAGDVSGAVDPGDEHEMPDDPSTPRSLAWNAPDGPSSPTQTVAEVSDQPDPAAAFSAQPASAPDDGDPGDNGSDDPDDEVPLEDIGEALASSDGGEPRAWRLGDAQTATDRPSESAADQDEDTEEATDEVRQTGFSESAAAFAPLPASALTPEPVPAAKPASLLTERPDEVDDLKRIKGVGPVMEQVLNDKGVYLFHQVANFSPSDVAWVNDAIDAFPGRITRDDWVGQARALYRQKYGRGHDEA